MKLLTKRQFKRLCAATTASILVSTSASLPAQPNRGDLEIYETAIGTNNAGSVQPNLLFIADTSGSMDYYVAVEYQLTRDAYDPTFDYGGDGAAADDDYIYVYDNLETFSGVTITQAQNKCEALTTAHTNSPNYPVFSDKVLQWKPITSDVETSPAVVCETTSPGSTTIDLVSEGVSNSWDEMNFVSSIKLVEDDFISGTEMTLTLSNTGDRHMKGGIWVARTYSNGTQTGSGFWLCYRNTWNKGQTRSCTGDLGDIGWSYYEIEVWFNGQSGGSSASGSLEYNKNAPETQVDPDCSPSDALIEELVTDGEWSGTLETNSDAAYILECAEDAGVQGINNSSTDDEVAFCGAASCTDPRYVASSGVDWTSEGLSDKYFYTGNYHDYLNYRPVPGDLFDTRNTNYVRDRGTSNDWYSTSNRSVESFCNLFRYHDRVATDFTDTDTWSTVVGHRVTAPNEVYLEDGDDNTDFIYVCRQKQQTMIKALTDMATSISGVNMGLMQFNTSEGAYDGGSVIYHVQNINDAVARAALVSEIAALPADGGTPLSATMSEAYRYFKGNTESYSLSSIDDNDAFVSGTRTYASPITHSCQSNNLVYITDGEPDGDSAGGLTGCSGNCLDEWAEKMASEDLSGTIDGNNRVTTYTVGFDIDFDLLEDAADKGNGEYFTTENYDDLMTAFQEILMNIAISESSTLVAPTLAVNAFNVLQHRSQIYYATFTPAFNPAWEGNVKRYAITGDGTVYGQAGSGVPVIGDDGFFKSSAHSFWSDFPDGASVQQGGYREQLTNTRNVYLEGSVAVGEGTAIFKLETTTNLKNTSFGTADAAEADELRDWLLGIDIDDYDGDTSTSDAHRYAADSLHSRPFVVTYSGSDEATARDILFVSTNMGSVRAIDARSAQGTELWSYIPAELVDNVKKYRDNDPTFRHWHAYGLDAEATVWAEQAAGSTASNFNMGQVYMYQGMRRGGDTYYAWDISNADVGLSGPGSDATKPPIENLWQINGGVTSPTTTGFADLGYTWSKMVRTKIRYSCTDAATNTGCTTKEVLVFSGGYDGYYDTPANMPKTSNASNTLLGRAVYVVDAVTGALLWSTGSDNTYALELPVYNSVPADPSPVDIDADGDMDALFFVDISGAIFRVDFNQGSALGSTYATGGMIANLRENLVFRRFYNGIDVSLLAPLGEESYFALSVGSGYRASPKEEETWVNRFYILVDENIGGPALYGPNDDDIDEDSITYSYVETRGSDTEGNEIVTDRAIITPSDLHVYTSADPYNRGRLVNAEDEPDGEYGFYRNLDSSGSRNYEKILQSSVTFGGDILVSSFLPLGKGNEAVETCGSGQVGAGRVYRFSVETGSSTFDTDGDGDIDANDDGYIDLERPGIPPDTTILLIPELVTCIGTECSDEWLDLETGQAERTYWRED